MPEHRRPYERPFAIRCKQVKDWLLQEKHKQQFHQCRRDMVTAFTRHPRETGESYPQHLWFTLTIASRLIYTGLVLITHGVFPFLLTRAASAEIEDIYRVVKGRIPKARRIEIDAAFDDYSV